MRVWKVKHRRDDERADPINEKMDPPHHRVLLCRSPSQSLSLTFVSQETRPLLHVKVYRLTWRTIVIPE